MELANQFILVSAALLTLSIFVSIASERFGAPLLLVFLALGMLAGEDGLGGINFDDFQAAYLIGSIALAVILFDGGLRTSRESLRLALAPAAVLATLGVVITAVLTGACAVWVLDLGWREGLLVGSIVASTDAAAVFFLLRLHGMSLKRRVGAVLEVESGLNDPMAVFLTLTSIALLSSGIPDMSAAGLGTLGLEFAVQIVGGGVLGLAGGYLLLWLVNRLVLASGLYPVLAFAFALLVFGGAQTVGASGFLAVFLVGLILGNHRHRAAQRIDRFHDALAWLSQIVMFLMLGLLVTPSALVPTLAESVAIAAFLIVIGRPAAVLLCLLPFHFTWPERAFVAWVGLRGAVPIFLGSIPVLVGVEGSGIFFGVAFVVVLTSLVVQGWTVATAARRLGLELPPQPKAPERVDIDLPVEVGRDMAIYTVPSGSFVSRRSIRRLPLPPETNIASVVRDGTVRSPAGLRTLSPGDCVLVIVPAEQRPMLDRLFASPTEGEPKGRGEAVFGEFTFGGGSPVNPLADFYGFPVAEEQRGMALDEFLRERLPKTPVVGDRLRVGDMELVVREMEDDRITRVGLELEPEGRSPSRLEAARRGLKAWWRALRQPFARAGGPEERGPEERAPQRPAPGEAPPRARHQSPVEDAARQA